MATIPNRPATRTPLRRDKVRKQRRSGQALGASFAGSALSPAITSSRGSGAASEMAATNADSIPAHPTVRTIGIRDLKDAIARGFSDFRAHPTHVLFLSIIYPIVEFMSARYMLKLELLPLVFPLLAGVTLIGPFAAVGLYELSRRREHSNLISWWHAFNVLRSPAVPAIATLAFVLMVTFFIWLGAALVVYKATLGGVAPASVAQFAHLVLTTPSGWALIVVGNGIGLLFAILVFTLSVVSFPLLLDREVNVETAVKTSVTAVIKNPKVMGLWGLTVACGLVIGTLTFFVGLAVVMPVLAHSTWHLYRKVVSHPRWRQNASQ